MSLRKGLGATYRLQLHPGFGFAEAAGIVPYLARLGIETVYLSPIAEAVPGSPHGYDGTDPTRLRAELGGEPAYDALVAACENHDLGICVDHVPNHLATWSRGPWWRRLLSEGPASTVAGVFDVDWEAGGGNVVLPLLASTLEVAIADGTVRLGTREGEIVVFVGDLDLPLAAGTAGAASADAASAGDVATVLAAQHYRLADWHDPAGRNYRRFFDIDDLVGVRVEDPDVFARTQALVVGLARSGRLSALRIDHVDGLRRPTEYLRRLAAETGVPIVVEKILTGDERLRADWPVVGTTGYETIDDLGGVLVDRHGFDRLVAAGRGEGDAPVGPLTVESRRMVGDASFPQEIGRAAAPLGVDVGRLRDLLARLPRYRTYLDSVAGRPAGEEGAGSVGSALWHELDETSVWRALRNRDAPGADDVVVDALLEPEHREVMLGVQQVTGALMAKGVEDTAWYRLGGPLAFCEVGGDPGRRREDALDRWHEHASSRMARGVHGLVPGTTHDTKRAQDVRCRLYALSEMAIPFEEGLGALRRAMGLSEHGGDLAFETRVAAQLALGVLPPLGAGAGGDGAGGDGAGDFGAGDFGAGDAGWEGQDVATRLGNALVKGAREAKTRSSWSTPDPKYEARLHELAEILLADRGALLRGSFGPVLDEAHRLGALNSLSSVVLRHAFPGIPDCFQGDEVWNLSLVDPDNRRPVDFGKLSHTLELMEPGSVGTVDAPELRRSWRDGRVKLHVTMGCLRARRGPGGDALAPDADYLRLAASGPSAGSILTFARRGGTPPGPESWAVAVTTRLGGRLEVVGDDLPSGPSYEETFIPLPEGAPTVFSDVLTERRVVALDGVLDVRDVLASLPVALLLAGPAR